MPYADPMEKAEFQRTAYLRRYQNDPEFRADEALRKAMWYYRNQEKIVAAKRQARRKRREGRLRGTLA